MRGMENESEEHPVRRPTGAAALAALLLSGCAQLCEARSHGQTTFPSPEDASRALFLAVQRHDDRAVTAILGAGTELVSSGDKVQDALDRERFVQKYREMHRLVPQRRGVLTLYVGAENWPFPSQLVSRDGLWHFDADGGATEVRFRRIGENEVTAIGICHALAAAETHPGTDSESDAFVGTTLPDIRHASRSVPFHGYYFRVLKNTDNGFAAIAYPAVYRSSGVMSFTVNDHDVVYEKDLGPNTANTANTASVMDGDRVDPTWAPAESAP